MRRFFEMVDILAETGLRRFGFVEVYLVPIWDWLLDGEREGFGMRDEGTLGCEMESLGEAERGCVVVEGITVQIAMRWKEIVKRVGRRSVGGGMLMV